MMIRSISNNVAFGINPNKVAKKVGTEVAEKVSKMDTPKGLTPRSAMRYVDGQQPQTPPQAPQPGMTPEQKSTYYVGGAAIGTFLLNSTTGFSAAL